MKCGADGALQSRWRPSVTASDGVTVGVWGSGNRTGNDGIDPSWGRVRGAWFSPDGSRIPTASVDHTARLWDSRTDCRVAGFHFFHGGEVSHAQFSPDGAWVATAFPERLRPVWECPPVPVPGARGFGLGRGVGGRRFGAAAGADLVPVVEQVLERERRGAAATDFFTRFAQWVQSDPEPAGVRLPAAPPCPTLRKICWRRPGFRPDGGRPNSTPSSSRAWAVWHRWNWLKAPQATKTRCSRRTSVRSARFVWIRPMRDAQQVPSAARERMRISDGVTDSEGRRAWGRHFSKADDTDFLRLRRKPRVGMASPILEFRQSPNPVSPSPGFRLRAFEVEAEGCGCQQGTPSFHVNSRLLPRDQPLPASIL